MRKFFIILTVLLVIGATVFFLFFRNSINPNSVPDVLRPLFPVGNQVIPVDETGAPEIPSTNQNPDAQRLTQITTVPVAGFYAYQESRPRRISTEEGTITTQQINEDVLRYVHRRTGYVFERRGAEDARQITNLIVGNVYFAIFGDRGNSVALRFLQDDGQTIGTYVVPIPPENEDGTRTQQRGFFLPNGIREFVSGPSMINHARLMVSQGNGVVSTASFNNRNIQEILRFPFTQWIIQWPNESTLYLQTKASAQAQGFLYSINTRERVLRRILGDIRGLTTLVSPSGNTVIYSQSTNTSFNTFIYNTQTGQFFRVDQKILPEKCAWTPEENLICAGSSFIPEAVYPDSWYAGITSFTDSFYRIDIETGLVETLFEPITETFDATQLQVEPRGEYTYFIDKQSGLLWRLRIR